MDNESEQIFEMHHRIHHQFFQCVNRMLENPAVHPGQAALIGKLMRHGSLSQAALCRRLDVSAATVAVSLQRLEKQGFLTRVQNPNDLREKLLCLTPEGEKIAEEIEHVVVFVQKQAIEGFTSEEFAQLKEYITRISANLESCKDKLSSPEKSGKSQGV